MEEECRFGLFRFVFATKELWRGGELINLKPQAGKFFDYLIKHSPTVIGYKDKQALLEAGVWEKAYLEKASLKVAINEIRKALGEDAQNPRYIQTVRGEGWCFLPDGAAAEQAETSTRGSTPRERLVVGRDREVQMLQNWLGAALHGERQMVFVTGEAGIGKTAVVDRFLDTIHTSGLVRIGRGQCFEQYGEGEAYLPVLDALGQLCRGPNGKDVIEVLRQSAPTWLIQMPSIASSTEREYLQQTIGGTTPERMLREMAEAVEVLTVETGLILVVEDLQWSDHSTLDLLTYLAQRRQSARLLVLGTYRPADVIVSGHPLRSIQHGLQVNPQTEELGLELLPLQDVQRYIEQRFALQGQSAELARSVHRRTEGNALFMVNLIENLLQQGSLRQVKGRWEVQHLSADTNVPEGLRETIAGQIGRLTKPQQQVLEVASVVGTEFSTASVAAGVARDPDEVETICEELAFQGLFLRELDPIEWPDGTLSGQYAFQHALYQNVLYDRIGKRRRIDLHRKAGDRLEAGYGKQAEQIAAELAIHFELGADHRRAVQYRWQAGERAIRRSAYREAINHFTKGLELLYRLSESPERSQQELLLQTSLGVSLATMKGFGDPEMEQVYVRARELCQQFGDIPQLSPVLTGLWASYIARADLQTAQKLAEQMLHLAQNGQDLFLIQRAHNLMGTTLHFLGKFSEARTYFEHVMGFSHSQQLQSHALFEGQAAPITCRSSGSWVLWTLGYPDQALTRSLEALSLARDSSLPFILAMAMNFSAVVFNLRREGRAAQEQAEVGITLATDKGFPLWVTLGTFLRGWALTEQGRGEEGIAEMRHGLDAFRATGAELARPYFLAQLAEVYWKRGQIEEGLTTVAEALELIHKTGERWYEAELYRLKGQLTLQSTVQSRGSRVRKSPKAKDQKLELEAETCFQQAIEIAQRQQAKSLELRAVMSLSRLWQQQGKHHEARTMLSEIYDWFTEGFDTKDLQEAKTLLEELNSGVLDSANPLVIETLSK